MAIDDEWNQYMLEFNYDVRLKFGKTFDVKPIY